MSSFSTQFNIAGRTVGLDSPVYIIAEAGVSHFGSEEKAYKLVDMAADAGADAVKFQVFDVDAMIAKESSDWKERLGSRQLPYETFERIQRYCMEKNITFFATAHDEPSLEFLMDLDVPVYKIGSGEVGNWPYMKRIAEIGKPVIFSTGMYRQEQIDEALNELAKTGNRDIAVLHCVTDYPAPVNDISLGNMKLIRDTFQVITGYSDHTVGFHIPLASVALGASIVEKHITLDYNIPNAQDWKVSCGPDNLDIFVKQVREIEATLTTRISGPTENEKNSILWAGKSLVMKHEIPKGKVITESDLSAKRPGSGISPSQINEVLGHRAKNTLYVDELIRWEDLD